MPYFLTDGDMDTLLDALFYLGLALAHHDHQWTDRERTAYDRAVKIVRLAEPVP